MSTTSRAQRTLARPATVQGFGYWSGADVRVEFRPLPAHSGLIFVRVDCSSERRVPALVQNRREVPRRTVLTADGATVEMVEHILAALAALQIDNCEIRVTGPEMPACDGSSLAFVEVLEAAGSVEQSARRRQLTVRETVRVGDENCWVEARPARDGGFHIAYDLDYGSGPIGQQSFRLAITPDSFRRELAPARTFVLEHEAQWLRQQGLCQRVSYSDLIVFGPEGPIDNPLRFADECVRHKALDLVGDLALAGCDLVGEFHAHKSGHRLNAELVQTLLARETALEPERKIA